MATETFDRPLCLTEKGAKKLFELIDEWDKKTPKPDGIKPYTAEERKESEELLRKYLFHSKN